MIRMPSGLYVLACVLVPVCWGLLMVVVVGFFERLAAKRRPGQDKPEESSFPHLEYHL